MKKRLLALCLTLCLLVGLLPTVAFAAPVPNGSGLTSDDPMVVPEEGMVIQGTVLKEISQSWLTKNKPSDGSTFYVKVVVSDSITELGDGYGGFRLGSGYSLQMDFSNATSLKKINSQAFLYATALQGILDLSNTKVETIEKSAFNGCTGLTGVIFPSTLKNLTTPGVFNTVNGVVDPKDPVGSVFNGCTGLEFVRTAGGNSNTVFEFPSTLEVIGRQSFKGCTGLPENTTVVIPQSVTLVGSEAFYNAGPITTVIVSTSDASQYHGTAFKGSNYGLGKRLTVFKDSAAKNSYISTGNTSYGNSLTYEFTLHYGQEGGTDVRTEPKLYGQAVNVCKAENGNWAVNADYEIPEAGSANVPIGYSGGWAYNNKLLTTTTVLKPTGDHLYLDVQKVLQNPTVEFIVNGEKIETEDTYPELRVSAGSTVGVQVSHPVEDVDVKFEYEWIDVWKGGHEGPRMEEDGFGRYNLWDNPEVTNTITINGTEDERTSSGNYTNEDYGDGYYLLVIYGYSKPKSGGQWTKFYQSANTAIAPDPDRTVNTAYRFDITIAEPITIIPADITVYTGGEGYTGVVDSAGQTTTTQNGLPEPGYYVTLPNWINEQLGGNDHAVDLSEILTLTYADGSTTREWKLQLYGTDAHSTDVAGADRARYIYRLLPGVDENNNKVPIRLQLKDGDTVITSDKFTPDMDEQYKQYEMSIYSGGLDTSKIIAQIKVGGQTETCTVASDSGTLVVRGLQNEETTTPIAQDKTGISSSNISAVAPDNVTYYVNGSNVEVANTEGVKLLVDDVLSDGVLAEHIENNMTDDIPAGNYTYEEKYLDLVDTKNGNAYLTLGDGQKMTMYWPMPSDMDTSKDFHIVHFEALDRNYNDMSSELAKNPPKVVESNLTTVNGKQYIQFETGSFSPFVLVYEQKASGGGGGTTSYTITASAGTGGSIDPSGKVSVTSGSDKKFTITPADGYVIADVLVDGKSVGAVSSYTFEKVKASHTISASFEKELVVVDPDETGVSAWLNTKDHKSYLDGYPDGTFKPGQNMTRAEAAQMFYNLLLDQDVAITASFADVAADAWYAKAVNTLATIGMINGVSDDRYEPERSITRAEFTAIAMRFAKLPTGGENIFSDVTESDWFYDVVVGSIQYGWINGYSDGTFRPNATITRAEVTAITNRMLGRSADTAYVDGHVGELRLFPDVEKGYWAYYPIVEATNAHDYQKNGANEQWTALL